MLFSWLFCLWTLGFAINEDARYVHYRECLRRGPPSDLKKMRSAILEAHVPSRIQLLLWGVPASLIMGIMCGSAVEMGIRCFIMRESDYNDPLFGISGLTALGILMNPVESPQSISCFWTRHFMQNHALSKRIVLIFGASICVFLPIQ